VAERIASEILSLPMYPHLEAAQQRRIAQAALELLSTKVSVTANRISPRHPSFEIASS